MSVGPWSTRPWLVHTSAALPPRSIAMEIESARSRLPPLRLQKMPLVQIPPTCITLLEAEVWMKVGFTELPFVVCANVTDQGDRAASEGVKYGVLRQMKSSLPVLQAPIQGKKRVHLFSFTFKGEVMVTSSLLTSDI